MNTGRPNKPLVAIACGGTGGHLFPGLAVANQLLIRGCEVLALVSPKEVDQQSVKTALGIRVATLPAVGMTRRNLPAFVAGLWKSYRASRRLFRDRPPQAVLAMGGFTCAPPVLAGRACGAATFLHESNTIPGKANRWLAHFVDQAFIGFSVAAGRLHDGFLRQLAARPGAAAVRTPERTLTYAQVDRASRAVWKRSRPRVRGVASSAVRLCWASRSGPEAIPLAASALVVAYAPLLRLVHTVTELLVNSLP